MNFSYSGELSINTDKHNNSLLAYINTFVKTLELFEVDIIRFPGPKSVSSERLGKVNVPSGHSIQERPTIQTGNFPPAHEVVRRICREMTATVNDMLDDPQNYGIEEQDVRGVDVEKTLETACRAILDDIKQRRER